MIESEFLELCSDLHDKILKYAEKKDVNQEDKIINNPMLSIRIDIDQIIDESHGIIESDNDDLKESFKKVFNQACNIKSHLREIEHFKSDIRKVLNKNPEDNEELAYASSMFAFSYKSLKNSLEKTLQLTQEVINMGKTK